MSRSSGLHGPVSRRRLLILGGGVVAAGLGSVLLTSSVGDQPPPEASIVPDVAADGVTDDRAAIQRALDAAPGDRPWSVWLPGLCYVGAGGRSAGAPFGLVVRRSRVTLTGGAGAGLVSREPGMRLLLIGGVPGAPDDPLDPEAWITSAPVLPFAEVVEQGAEQVRLSRAEDAARLRPGDLVFLRTGQLTSARLAREPDSELNEVLDVAGTRVNLRHPTAKPYEPERLGAGAPGLSRTDGDGRPTPWGLSVAAGSVVRDVTVRGLRLLARSTSGTSIAVRLHQAWGVVVSDCDVEFGKYGIGGRYARDVRISATSLHTLGADSDQDPAWIAPSTGCTEWLVEGCRGSGAAPAKIHAHEGVADLRVVDWRSETPDGSGQAGAANVSVRARAYRHVYELDMAGAYTAANCSMVRVTSEVVGPMDQVQFQRLRLRGEPGLAFISVESTAVTIRNSGLDIPADAPVVLLNGASPFE